MENPKQLEQRVGIRCCQSKQKPVVSLFAWYNDTINTFETLKDTSTRNSLDEKKYCHICYLRKCTYIRAIDPNRKNRRIWDVSSSLDMLDNEIIHKEN